MLHPMRLGGIATLAVAAAIGLSACGSSGGTATADPPPVAASYDSSIHVPSPTDIATDAPPAETPPTADPTVLRALAFRSWLDGGGTQLETAFQADLNQLATAAGNVDSPGVEAAAIKLKADVDRAKAYDPMPDATVQVEWAATLDDLCTAADDFVTGAATSDADTIMAGNAALTSGTSHLKVATSLITSY